MKINLVETGFVLRVKNYKKCFNFYANVLELKIRFKKPYFTNFQFGKSYLLLEKGEAMPYSVRHRENPPIILRMNVVNVNKAVKQFKAKGVKAKFFSFDWGDIGKINDPDGNLIELCKWK